MSSRYAPSQEQHIPLEKVFLKYVNKHLGTNYNWTKVRLKYESERKCFLPRRVLERPMKMGR